jgi:hypothetical protein
MWHAVSGDLNCEAEPFTFALYAGGFFHLSACRAARSISTLYWLATIVPSEPPAAIFFRAPEKNMSQTARER